MTIAEDLHFTINQGRILNALSRACQQEMHVLVKSPQLLWQQLYNRLQWEDASVNMTLMPELERRSRSGSKLWLKNNTPVHESQSLVRTIPAQTYSVISCTFSSADDFIFSSDSQGVIRVFETSSGKQVNTFDVGKNVAGYYYSENEGIIRTICEDGTLHAREISTGKPISTKDILSDIKVCAFSPEGSLLLTYHQDKSLNVWNVKSRQVVSTLVLPARLNAINRHPWKAKFVTGDVGGGVYILEVMNIAFDPIIITAFSSGNGISVCCPSCQQEHDIYQSQLGKQYTCLTTECGVTVLLNSFTIDK